MIGRTFGPYQIVAKVGQGGMGEVYRARDTRLDRTVAIKVLAPHRLHDSGMRLRLDREARTIAALNHPHICHLHDVGHQDGIDYLVMEFLEGETLAARLSRTSNRSPLPQDELFTYAIQMADALAEAHQHGIVHRDLKPGNVMLTRTGVKLLDFGLARLAEASDAGEMTAPTRDVTLTAEGSVMGTWPYMAPEQLEGRPVDARSDIFAFGAVLYEMATGRRAFEGDSQARLAAAILERDPDPFGTTAAQAPPALERLVRKCLAKRPDARWESARLVADALRWLDEERKSTGGQAAVPAVPPAPARGRWRRAATLGVVAVLGALFAWTWIPRPTSAPPSLRRFEIEPRPHRLSAAHFALSRDGRTLVYAASSDGRSALYVRPFDQLVPRVIEGTDGGSFPVFSPDGQWLAFFTRDRLRKVALSPGATPVTLAEVPDSPIDHSVTWLQDNTIVFGVAARDEAIGGLWRVPAEGGAPERLTTPDPSQGEIDHHTPRPLVGSHAILVTRHKGAEAYDVAVLHLDTREVKVVVPDAFDARYLPTGHLLFARGSALFVAPFDADRLEVTGPAVVMVDQVRTSLNNGAARYEVAEDGTLVVVPSADPVGRYLAWVGGNRPPDPLPINGKAFSRPSLSLDGTRIAVQVDDGSRRDIYVYDRTPGTLVPLTTDGLSEAPHWTPDGGRVTFSRTLQGRREVYWQPFDGSAPAERLVSDPFSVFAGGWSTDGQALAILRQPPTDLNEIGVYYVQDKRAAAITVAAMAARPRISPDGHWIAYESGEGQIVVEAIQGGARRQITSEAGFAPVWGGNGRLYYVRRETQFTIFVVDLSQFPRVIGKAEAVARDVQMVIGSDAHAGYAVGPDGRLLVVQPGPEDLAPPRFEIVLNWFEEVKQRTGPR